MKNLAKFIEANPLLVLGLAAGVIGAAWISMRDAKGFGADIGAAVVDTVIGAASGAGKAATDAANNPDINPLQPVGSWLGRTIYDLTH